VVLVFALAHRGVARAVISGVCNPLPQFAAAFSAKPRQAVFDLDWYMTQWGRDSGEDWRVMHHHRTFL
jgi:hypothetical protein